MNLVFWGRGQGWSYEYWNHYHVYADKTMGQDENTLPPPNPPPKKIELIDGEGKRAGTTPEAL